MRNRFKQQRLPRGINTTLMDQELVARMCTKSKMLFGSKWRWRLLCGRNMIDPTELEKRFDTVIDQQLNNIKEQIANEQQQSNEQLGTTVNTSREEATVSGDNGQSESEDSSSGDQARSGEANDVPSTTSSTE